MSGPLAALAGALLFAAAWELAAVRPLGSGRRPLPLMPAALARAGWAGGPATDRRLERAGLAGRWGAREMMAAKLAGAACGALAVLAIVPGAPVRVAPFLVAGLLAAGFLAPDALLERRGRLREARLVAALPDALDLLAVGAAAGKRPVVMLAELARTTRGPLAAELARVAADAATGAGEEVALRDLAARVEHPAVAALVATLERSRRYGSPLAEQLHAAAAALRSEERRRIEERSARAAPKIQLVVALLLVPSALLGIAAALVANADSLLAGLR